MAVKIRNNQDLSKYRRLSYEQGTRLYAQLRQQVIAAGILDRSYLYYAILIPFEFFCFLFLVYQFIIQTNPIFVIFATIGISIFAVRFGGLIHDAGHRAMFKSSLVNDLFGYFCSLFVAFPYIVWQVKHNAYHAHTNEEGSDPDIEVPISFTSDMMKRNTPIVRIFKKYQAWLFYPLGSMVSLTMRLKAFRYYIQNLSSKVFFVMVLQFVGMILWYVVPFFVFLFGRHFYFSF